MKKTLGAPSGYALTKLSSNVCSTKKIQKSTARLAESVMMMARVGLRGRKRPRSAWRAGNDRGRRRRSRRRVTSVNAAEMASSPKIAATK